MTYPGGKNAAGVCQRIINHMPPHKVYIEPFLGSGAVLRMKRPAEINIGMDRSEAALSICLDLAGEKAREFRLIQGNALEDLASLGTMVRDSKFIDRPDTLIYLDPPYLMKTRKSGPFYDFELSEADHETLLKTVLNAPSMIMISGYRSALYDDLLSGFHRIDYQAQTRRGRVAESLWMNFAPPTALHDYSHLGDCYRERERIKRKKARWAAKFAAMDRRERLAIMDALVSAESAATPETKTPKGAKR